MTTLIRGDSKYFRIPFTHPVSGEPFDLTGCDIWVTAKRNPNNSDAQAIYQHTMRVDGSGTVTASNGLSLETTAAAGVVIQRISPEESKLFLVGKQFVDVQIRHNGTDVSTPVLGDTDDVVIDVTHAIVMT